MADNYEIRKAYGVGRKIFVTIGAKFGLWTVIRDVGPHPRFYYTRSDCRCECGTVATVRNGSLVSGISVACRSCSMLRAPEYMQKEPRPRKPRQKLKEVLRCQECGAVHFIDQQHPCPAGEGAPT